MTFHHFRRVHCRPGECLENISGGAFKLDLDKHQQPAPQFGRRQARAIALNDPLAGQAFYPLGNSGLRQADALGQVDIGDAPVFLQHPENTVICLIH